MLDTDLQIIGRNLKRKSMRKKNVNPYLGQKVCCSIKRMHTTPLKDTTCSNTHMKKD